MRFNFLSKTRQIRFPVSLVSLIQGQLSASGDFAVKAMVPPVDVVEGCDFEDEIAEYFRSDPKIIPPATVSSLTTSSVGSTSADEDEKLSLAKAVPTKKRPRSKSSTTEIIEFLTEIKEEKRKEEQRKCDLV